MTLLKVAVYSLLSNKLRSFLAVLGIIIGVGAVIAMLGIAAGAKAQVLSTISAMGTELLIVRPAQRGSGGVMTGTQQNLTVEDAEAILKEIPEILQVSPAVQGRGQVKYFEKNSNISYVGASVTYFPIRAFEIEKGRVFTDTEEERLAHVAVLGPVTAETLMGEADPIGETIKLNGLNFQVIGVTKAKGDQGWFNPDDQVIIPCKTAMKHLLGVDYVREIDIQCRPGSDLMAVQDRVVSLIRKRHRTLPDMPDDIEIRNQAEILNTASQVTRTFTVLLGTVAGISLLVGGIGIMNIMLVTVTERTREIGVRKAIGAKDRDILRQFLFEATLMSGLGGLIGVGAGVGAAKAIGLLTSFQTVLSPQSMLMAMVFAASVGIFFGYYPARRAAKLNPIDALRYE
ncbi:MAG: ABC transporter permease [FCB group bacterium]|jgi:putative ABC transport system permease protein|nr:ABC transporter permease [FCB group bacterium]